MKKRAIFFDRDGIVNVRKFGGYITSADEFEFRSDFIKLFKFLSNSDYLLILITNQQGIGKGLMSEDDLTIIHEQMQRNLQLKTRREFDDIYYCPDLAESGSLRRKPNPGMILEAIEKWEIDAENSWMIGDAPTDIEAGKKAGVHTIFISPDGIINKADADYCFANLTEIIDLIKGLETSEK